MTKWAPQKTDVLDALVAEILHNYARARAAIAIDGIPGAGTEQFARDMAAAFARQQHPAIAQVVGGGSMIDGTDAARIRSDLIPAFRSAEPTPSVLLIAGFGLLRPDLRGSWTYTIWLDVSREVADARATAPDDTADRDHYWSEIRPRAAASAIIDTTDVEHPRRVFADFC